MSLRPSVQPAQAPHHAVLSPRAVAVLGCGWNRDVGAVMPCGVGFCTDEVSFVVTTKSRQALDPSGMLFKVDGTTPQMSAIRDAMNKAARSSMYRKIYVFETPIDEQSLIAILPKMGSEQYESERVREAFSDVQSELDEGFDSKRAIVMFRFNGKYN
jgi:hypothetical protein